MVPFPNLPTGNLYKFLALFGLILMVVAICIPILTYERGMDVFANRLLDASQKLLHDPSRGDKELESYTTEVEILNDFRQANREAVAIQSKALGPVFNMGAVISSVGFILWYVMVQRYEDRILRAQTAIAERDAMSPKKVEEPIPLPSPPPRLPTLSAVVSAAVKDEGKPVDEHEGVRS